MPFLLGSGLQKETSTRRYPGNPVPVPTGASVFWRLQRKWKLGGDEEERHGVIFGFDFRLSAGCYGIYNKRRHFILFFAISEVTGIPADVSTFFLRP